MDNVICPRNITTVYNGGIPETRINHSDAKTIDNVVEHNL